MVTVSSYHSIYPYTKKDSGVYSCTAKNRFGQSEPSNEVLFITVEQPEVILEPEIPVIGGPLNMTCRVESHISAHNYTLRWYKNGVFLEDAQTVLHIAELEVEDEGFYSCRINFLNGFYSVSDEKAFSIAVLQRPVLRIPEVNLNQTSLSFFSCVSNETSRRLVKSGFLYRQGVLLMEIMARGPVVMFEVLVRQRDHGNYTCTLTNSEGESEHSAPVEILTQTYLPGRPYLDSSSAYLRDVSNTLSCRTLINESDYCTLYLNDQSYQQ
ncbi:sialoadhesin-like, partial [Aplysia californica]|uniref:Sialoadhesin-like n=1 Tax=Aplysia californica TaxID=6500 RepID=A0ABM1VP99_APLCA